MKTVQEPEGEIQMEQNTELWRAFYAGQEAFTTGKSEILNPFALYTEEYREWKRGYRNARKHARFNATIAARRS